jgi:hypothetical protein
MESPAGPGRAAITSKPAPCGTFRPGHGVALAGDGSGGVCAVPPWTIPLETRLYPAWRRRYHPGLRERTWPSNAAPYAGGVPLADTTFVRVDAARPWPATAFQPRPIWRSYGSAWPRPGRVLPSFALPNDSSPPLWPAARCMRGRRAPLLGIRHLASPPAIR